MKSFFSMLLAVLVLTFCSQDSYGLVHKDSSKQEVSSDSAFHVQVILDLDYNLHVDLVTLQVTDVMSSVMDFNQGSPKLLTYINLVETPPFRCSKTNYNYNNKSFTSVLPTPNTYSTPRSKHRYVQWC